MKEKVNSRFVPKIRYIEKYDLEDIVETKVHNANREFGHKFPFDIEGYLWKIFKFRVQPTRNAEVRCNVDTALIVCKNLIRIDERVYERQYERARFSIAHEVGHLILHEDYLNYVKKLLLSSGKTDEFQRILLSLPDKESRRAEYQAQYFAGAVLAPASKLKSELISYLRNNIEKNDDFLTEDEREEVYSHLAKFFEMTKEAIRIRIDKCDLTYLLEHCKNSKFQF